MQPRRYHCLQRLIYSQQLPKGSPVRWAISESLLQARLQSSVVTRPQPDLEFIYSPLRNLFDNQPRDLVRTLKHLAVLEARFQRQYLQEDDIDWTRNFDVNTEFFDLVSAMTAQDLAAFLTNRDRGAFYSLSPHSILKEDCYLQHMHRRWDRLCREAQEIIAAGNGFCALTKLAKASLYTWLL